MIGDVGHCTEQILSISRNQNYNILHIVFKVLFFYFHLSWNMVVFHQLQLMEQLAHPFIVEEYFSVIFLRQLDNLNNAKQTL